MAKLSLPKVGQHLFAAASFKDAADNSENGEEAKSEANVKMVRREIHVERKDGGRRASIRDFHSFRVTWVTLALTAGVPMELVQKVTGHKTAEIVFNHYFKPGREQIRQALQSAMPKLLTNGQKTPKDEMRSILERMTAKTLDRDKARLLKLLPTV